MKCELADIAWKNFLDFSSPPKKKFFFFGVTEAYLRILGDKRYRQGSRSEMKRSSATSFVSLPSRRAFYDDNLRASL